LTFWLLGYEKIRETWTNNGLNLIAAHIEAPGAVGTATESFIYDLDGRQIEHPDLANKLWKTHSDDCCGLVNGS